MTVLYVDCGEPTSASPLYLIVREEMSRLPHEVCKTIGPLKVKEVYFRGDETAYLMLSTGKEHSIASAALPDGQDYDIHIRKDLVSRAFQNLMEKTQTRCGGGVEMKNELLDLRETVSILQTEKADFEAKLVDQLVFGVLIGLAGFFLVWLTSKTSFFRSTI